MNNEPVAWRRMEENGWYVYYETKCWDDLIPLYTHPAKTLTDEEIDDALSEAFSRGARFGYAEGLKKASER